MSRPCAILVEDGHRFRSGARDEGDANRRLDSDGTDYRCMRGLGGVRYRHCGHSAKAVYSTKSTCYLARDNPCHREADRPAILATGVSGLR